MTGLIVGALRALWPWQTEDDALLAPDDRFPVALLLCLLGAAMVVGIVLFERRNHPPTDRDHGVLDATRGRHAQKTP
jgi:putative membrane protein